MAAELLLICVAAQERLLATGDDVAGLGIGVINAPVVNDGGAIAVVVTAGREVALLVRADGRWRVAAKSGDAIPGGGGAFRPPPGDEIGPFRGVPRLNNRGTVAFLATFDPDSERVYASAAGVFTETTTALKDGDALGEWRTSMDTEASNAPALGEDDTFVFATVLRKDDAKGAALVAWRDGEPAVLVRRGDAVPGGGATFDSPSAEDPLGFGPPGISTAGHVRFTARQRLTDRSALGSFDTGFREVLYDADGPRRLLGTGDALPETRRAVSELYTVKFAPAVNAKGATALLVSTGGEEQIVVVGDGAVRHAAATGLEAPGGGVYSRLAWTPSIDDRGRVAFVAKVREGTLSGGEAILFGPPGDLNVVAKTGDGTFRSFTESTYGFVSGHRPNLSADGRLAFLAEVEADGGRALALYVYDAKELRRIVRTGDEMEGKVVRDLRFNGVASPGVRGLNASGVVVFTTIHEDGTNAIWCVGP